MANKRQNPQTTFLTPKISTIELLWATTLGCAVVAYLQSPPDMTKGTSLIVGAIVGAIFGVITLTTNMIATSFLNSRTDAEEAIPNDLPLSIRVRTTPQNTVACLMPDCFRTGRIPIVLTVPSYTGPQALEILGVGKVCDKHICDGGSIPMALYDHFWAQPIVKQLQRNKVYGLYDWRNAEIYTLDPTL